MKFIPQKPKMFHSGNDHFKNISRVFGQRKLLRQLWIVVENAFVLFRLHHHRKFEAALQKVSWNGVKYWEIVKVCRIHKSDFKTCSSFSSGRNFCLTILINKVSSRSKHIQWAPRKSCSIKIDYDTIFLFHSELMSERKSIV